MFKGPVVEKAVGGRLARHSEGPGRGLCRREEKGENDGSTGRIGKSLVEGRSLPREGGQQKSPRDFAQGTEAVRSAFRESCFTYCAESGPTGEEGIHCAARKSSEEAVATSQWPGRPGGGAQGAGERHVRYSRYDRGDSAQDRTTGVRGREQARLTLRPLRGQLGG